MHNLDTLNLMVQRICLDEGLEEVGDIFELRDNSVRRFMDVYGVNVGKTRDGQCLLYFVIQSKDGNPIRQDVLKEAMSALINCVERALRRGDVGSRFNDNLYMALILHCETRAGHVVIKRILDRWNTLLPSQLVDLKYRCIEL